MWSTVFSKTSIQSRYEQVNNSAKCSSLYKHVKCSFGEEHYLTSLPDKLRLSVYRLRTSNHKLSIETGRYTGIDRKDILCTLCKKTLGDEFHFVLECKYNNLVDIRKKYISNYYYTRPNMFKLQQLLCSKGKKLVNLSKFLYEGFKLLHVKS